eukprot:1978097-Rhodomonas_salina.1
MLICGKLFEICWKAVAHEGCSSVECQNASAPDLQRGVCDGERGSAGGAGAGTQCVLQHRERDAGNTVCVR